MPTRCLAALAAFALAAAPTSAAELPTQHNSAPMQATSNYGPYVGIGGGWGWGGGYRDRYRRRGSTAGDILTGVLILGTIAAVANAAKRAGERRGYPDRYPYPERRADYRTDGLRGVDGAADLCLREVERNARAREVTRVERGASGWLVTGTMADGAAFTCSIGADGRIERLDVGGRAQDVATADRQYDDRTYSNVRGDDVAVQPAYPGGPLPGEDAGAETPEG